MMQLSKSDEFKMTEKNILFQIIILGEFILKIKLWLEWNHIHSREEEIDWVTVRGPMFSPGTFKINNFLQLKFHRYMKLMSAVIYVHGIF